MLEDCGSISNLILKIKVRLGEHSLNACAASPQQAASASSSTPAWLFCSGPPRLNKLWWLGRFIIHTATKPPEAAVISLYAPSLFVDPVQCVLKPMYFTWGWKWAEEKRAFSLRPRGKFWNAPSLYIYSPPCEPSGWWDWTQTAYTHKNTHTLRAQSVCRLCSPMLVCLRYFKNESTLTLTCLVLTCFILKWCHSKITAIIDECFCPEPVECVFGLMEMSLKNK